MGTLKRTTSVTQTSAPSKKRRVGFKKRRVPINLQLQPELKYNQSLQNQQSITAGTVFTIAPTQIAQGDDYNMRSGMKISPEWIRLRMTIGGDPAAPTNLAEFRRIIFIDWGCNGAVPALGEVLLSTDAKSIKNYSFKDRFTIVRDDYFNVLAFANSTNQPWCEDTYVSMAKYFRNRKKYCGYQGTGSSVGSQGPGQIFVFILSDTSITGGTGNNGLSFSCVCGYFDS